MTLYIPRVPMTRPGFMARWNSLGDDLFPERGEAMDLNPKVEVRREDGHYMLTAEFPGMDRDDIHVDVKDGVLTLSGEKKREFEEEKEGYHYSERSYGSFMRSFRMPANASDDIKASFKDGVLTVEVKKLEETKPKVVAIES